MHGLLAQRSTTTDPKKLKKPQAASSKQQA